MKKIYFALVALIASVIISSCTTSPSTRITFTQLPQPVYYVVNSEGYISEETVKSQVAVSITTGTETNIYYLNNPLLEVTGLDFSTTGSKTLVVKYQSVSIKYSYQVVNPGEVVTTIDTTWYTANPNAPTFGLQDAADLRGLAKLVNDGTTTFTGKTIVLLNDIDLGNVTWIPIGEGDRNTNDGKFFEGTFDGNNHKISNLTNARYYFESTNTYQNSAGIILRGYCYGLFARVKDAVIKNVIIESVNIFADTVVENSGALYGGDSVGAIVGYVFGGTSFEIENCHVLSGTIIGIDAIAGIVGRDYKGYTIALNNYSKYNNLSNSANITATLTASNTGKAGGIVGIVTGKGHFESCENTGNVTSHKYSGGLVGMLYRYQIVSASNTGTISGPSAYNLIGSIDGKPGL